MEISNRTVIVTGGTGGIGQAICQSFGSQGDYVVSADIDREKGESWQKAFKDAGMQGMSYPVDLQRVDKIKAMVKQIETARGGVDILINNAGISRFTPLEDLTVAVWDEVLQVNLRSMAFLAKYCSESMKRKEGGRIVNIASTRYAMSEANSEAYAASKGGIVALTHALAVTLGSYGITVNAISPGWIETRDYASLKKVDHRQHPAGRVGRPEDIARLCLFLCRPENDFITAENIVVDGGMTRKMIYMD